MKYPIRFESRKNEAAHKAWIKALKIIGGPALAARLSGIRQSKLSHITSGCAVKEEQYKSQCFPTLEQAIKISILTEGKVSAENLLPAHNFKYIYKYVNMRKKK